MSQPLSSSEASSAVPIEPAPPTGDFEALRELILGGEKQQLEGLRRRLDNPALHAQDVSGVLPQAVTLAASRGPQLANALTPAVESALKESVRRDPAPFELARPCLEPCLQAHFAESARRKSSAPLMVGLGVMVLLLAAWAFFAVRESRRWTGYLDRLQVEPGIVVTEAGRRSGKHFVAGLRDPLAADPAAFLPEFKIKPEDVLSRWEPYQALSVALLLKRATQSLQPPCHLSRPPRGNVRPHPRAMIQKKICMVGPVSVGKTSLVARYVRSLFSEKYLSTVGVKVDKKVVQVGPTEVALLLWDLAGDDDFQRLNLTYVRGAAGYLLVADGSRAGTLDRALQIQDRVAQALGPIPFLLVLNKADLVAHWEIAEAPVAALVGQGWSVRRTSAKEGWGVEAAFQELAQRVLASPRPQPRPSPGL